jgi:hypothetical protein
MPVDMRYYDVLVRPSTRSGAAVPFASGLSILLDGGGTKEGRRAATQPSKAGGPTTTCEWTHNGVRGEEPRA